MRLLLDEHVAPAVARQLRSQGVDALALAEYQSGHYLGATDADVLAAATLEQRVLVTYDLRTIPEVLREWSEIGLHHSGVVLVDARTIRPSDVGGLVAAVVALAVARGEIDWTDRVEFLRRAAQSL